MKPDNFITWYFKSVINLIKSRWKQLIIFITVGGGALLLIAYEHIPYWIGLVMIFIGVFIITPYMVYLDNKKDKDGKS